MNCYYHPDHDAVAQCADPNDFFGGKLYYFQYGVKPSIDTEYYYTGIVKKSTYETFADDEAFMKDVVGQAGELIMMN